MPPRQSLTVTSSRELARRIAYERERRGWKQLTLARKMTEAGFDMTQSTISKFERADDGRRITVDELVAFSRVFKIREQELLVPLAAVLDRQVEKVMRRHRDANLAFDAAIDELIAAREEVKVLLARADKLGDAQLANAVAEWWSGQVGQFLKQPQAAASRAATDDVKRHLHNELIMLTGGDGK